MLEKNHRIKKYFRIPALMLCLILTVAAVPACSSGKDADPGESNTASALSTGVVSVEEDEGYGNVLIGISIDDFNALGFNYGDSLDVMFSNGYRLEDIPYYTGYYTAAGDPLIVAFDEIGLVGAVNYGSLWDIASLSDGDTAEITLHEAGKYFDIQDAMDLEYSDDRDDYESDEVFSNFRSINTGRLKKNILYRSASPCDNTRNRAPYTDDLVDEADIVLIVDLADSDEEIDGCMSAADFDSPYFASLYENGAVIPVNLQVDYTSDDYRAQLVEALNTMSKSDGPYLIHCLEGKDRTGFVCALLESLTGAGYDEMVEDYMKSYDNYYGVTPRSDPDKYNTIVSNNLIPMLTFITGLDDNADITSADFEAGATEYLLGSGMTKEEVIALKNKLTN